jgi:hypothetical protein
MLPACRRYVCGLLSYTAISKPVLNRYDYGRTLKLEESISGSALSSSNYEDDENDTVTVLISKAARKKTHSKSWSQTGSTKKNFSILRWLEELADTD